MAIFQWPTGGKQYTVHNGHIFRRLRTPVHASTHSLIFLHGSRLSFKLRPSRIIVALLKKSFVVIAICIHRMDTFMHHTDTVTQTPPSTSTTRTPLFLIATIRQHTRAQQACLAILPNDLLLQVFSPTSNLLTWLRTNVRRYRVTLEWARYHLLLV